MAQRKAGWLLARSPGAGAGNLPAPSPLRDRGDKVESSSNFGGAVAIARGARRGGRGRWGGGVAGAAKWNRAQAWAVGLGLRGVLGGVAEAVGEVARGRPLVDLVLTGHAHCLEYLRTGNTGHGDSGINWIVCGGSGHSLRRQRPEGPVLEEPSSPEAYRLAREGGRSPKGSRRIAECLLFVGRSGQGSYKRRPYSCLRIDVLDGCPPKFRIRPLVVERFEGKWQDISIEPFVI